LHNKSEQEDVGGGAFDAPCRKSLKYSGAYRRVCIILRRAVVGAGPYKGFFEKLNPPVIAHRGIHLSSITDTASAPRRPLRDPQTE